MQETWNVKLTKSNGEYRKQFSSWSIPKKIRKKYYIRDGMSCTISLKVGNIEKIRIYKITSGGEFRLPNHISKTIKSQAEKSSSKKICFVIVLTDIIQELFEEKVTESLNDSPGARRKRLATADKKNHKNITTTVTYSRNPDVVAEVLSQADGLCESCEQQAPFHRRSDGSPYLEVHHKTRLADGGEDTVENAIALCPNCHRKKHFG